MSINEAKCNCDMRTKLVGDGCSVCNPQYYIRLLEDQISEQNNELDKANERVERLEKALNPRFWNHEQSCAWHANIPDLLKAFEALRNVK